MIGKRYVAVCPEHDWEGMRRDNREEARKDLEGHKGLFPDETHTGAKIVEEQA